MIVPVEGLAEAMDPGEAVPGCRPVNDRVTAWQAMIKSETRTNKNNKRRMGGIIAVPIRWNCFTKLFLREAEGASLVKLG